MNHALAGRADLRDGRLRALLRLGRVGPGVASPRSPRGLPHGNPGAEPDDARIGCLRAAPGCRVVGLRQIDEMPHSPQRARSVSTGYAFVQNLRRRHYELAVDLHPNHRLPAATTELALAI
jgi:hypothetical protein